MTTDVSESQPLHLLLREHCARAGRKIVRFRMQGGGLGDPPARNGFVKET